MNGLCRGRVLDALTREPVIAATVAVEGMSGGTYTDTLGYFVVPARYVVRNAVLRVRSVGYASWSGAWNDPSQDLLVLLEPAEHALSTVVVSASMKDVSKDASPIPIEIYTPRFFQKNPTPNLFEALTLVNGVQPQLNCGVCGAGDIHINGLEGPYTMVTIDGMPIVSGLSTVYGLSGIPNSLVERIEVVKGPAGALYGSEAVGGLINIITRDALTAPRASVDAFGTSMGEWNLDGSIAARAGRAHTLLGVNYFHFRQRHDINSDNFTDIPLQQRLSVFNKWRFERRSGYFASLAARYVYEDRWGGQLTWAPQWRGSDSLYGESIYTHRMEVIGKYQLPIEGRRVMLDVSWNVHDQDAAYGNTPYFGRQQVAFAQLTGDASLGPKHDLLWGAALRYTEYDDNTPATAAADGSGQNRPARTWLPGVFVQDEIALNARNRLLMGLRYDYHSAHRSILTPRLSWKWAEDAHHILRLTAGSGFRVANIFTEEHAALTGARQVVIAEDLRPERSWNANLNYTRKFFPRKAGFIGIDASLFYTYFTNRILPDYDSDPDKIIYQNLNGHAVSSGASLNADVNLLNGLKINAGVTAMRVYRIEEGKRLPIFFASPLSGTWALSYPVTRWKLTIDYTGTFNSPMPLPVVPNDYRPDRSPWFAIHNAQITRALSGGIQLYVAVKNLFGFYPREDVLLRAFDPFDRFVEVDNPNGYTFDTAYGYAPVQRQRLLVGLRWTVR
ncbi:MAG: TonB-dependent receptor [Saprospiraceae bacterium]|nr:TonB-dependent receptor [Saprospiraceae bacterium]